MFEQDIVDIHYIAVIYKDMTNRFRLNIAVLSANLGLNL